MWSERTARGGRGEAWVSLLHVTGDFIDLTADPWLKWFGVSKRRLCSESALLDLDSVCKRIADYAGSIGATGLIVPSARDRHGTNIVILHNEIADAVTVVSSGPQRPPGD